MLTGSWRMLSTGLKLTFTLTLLDFQEISSRRFDDLKAFETFHDIMGFICDFKIHFAPFCDTLFLRSVFYKTRSSQCGISKAIPCITFKKNIVPMNDTAHFFSKQCNFIL